MDYLSLFINGLTEIKLLNIKISAFSHLAFTKEEIVFISIITFLIIIACFTLHLLREHSNYIKMLKGVEQVRNEIFAKITHEFRSPLTIIIGLSKQLREQKDLSNSNFLTYINAIERQGKNLSDLVNQLLDVSNLQTSANNLIWKTGNVVTFVEMITETFQIYAAQKSIVLQFFCNDREIDTDFVPDYLIKIIHNLISNAIKFSEEGTHIYVLMDRDKKNKNKLVLKVKDQGKGISKETLPNIFSIFYQNDSHIAGNGIGLAYTKQMVDILGGNIYVESEVNKGSVFTVELPLQKSESQIFPQWIPEKIYMQHTSNPIKEVDLDDSASFSHNEDDSRVVILLVEDNKDIGLYVKSMFSENSFNIIYCTNGETALELAKKYIPDIIITDIIMPNKNGIELCKDVKSSPILNHIPIIMISAKNSYEDVVEGLKNGADIYLQKPFQPEKLQLSVRNLLFTRNLLKEKYQRSILKEENITDESNINTEFLRHVTDIIYREMKSPNFTSNKLAEELALSVSQLNKKLNSITGYPSSAYILQVKLSHAKKIISTQNKNISEAATECGIYDVNYFSRVFKKHTGFTPTQYRRLPHFE